MRRASTIVIVLFFMLSSCSVVRFFIPNKNHVPFISTWEYQDGNDLFRINIWEDGKYLKGDYWFIEVNNGLETVICESDFNVPGTSVYSGYALFGGSNDGIKMGFQIDDNTINCENGVNARKTLFGHGRLVIQSGCLGCHVTALWEVERSRGIRIVGSPTEFSVPNNVI